MAAEAAAEEEFRWLNLVKIAIRQIVDDWVSYRARFQFGIIPPAAIHALMASVCSQ